MFSSLLSKLEKDKSEFEDLDAVIISGDIGYNGKQDYSRTKESGALYFFEELKRRVLPSGFDVNRFIICPGNHDVDREYLESIYKKNKININSFVRRNILKIEKIGSYDESAFKAYNDFCRDGLKINPYKNGFTDDANSYYTFGYKIVDGVCFLILNSCWLCLGSHEKYTKKNNRRKKVFQTDYGNQLLGHNLIEFLIKQIDNEIKRKGLKGLLKVAVVHHPPGWYHWSEMFNNDTRAHTPSLDLVNDFADIVFCGHEHGEIKNPSLFGEYALWIAGGSTFAMGQDENMYHNNVSLLEIDRKLELIERTPYFYMPGDKNNKWKKSEKSTSHLSGGLIRKLTNLTSKNLDKYNQVLDIVNQEYNESGRHGHGVEERNLGAVEVGDLCRLGLKLYGVSFLRIEEEEALSQRNIFLIEDKGIFVEVLFLSNKLGAFENVKTINFYLNNKPKKVKTDNPYIVLMCGYQFKENSIVGFNEKISNSCFQENEFSKLSQKIKAEVEGLRIVEILSGNLRVIPRLILQNELFQ